MPFLFGIISCKKNNDGGSPAPPPPPPPPPTVDTTGPLKNVAAFPVGIAIEYALFKNNATYKSIVAREADQVTFGYQMKHGAIVKDDGSFDFSSADELMNLAEAAGLKVYGHTLVWHSNQNGNYLRSLLVSNGSTSATNLLPTGDFEAGSGTSGATLFTGWNLLTGGNAVGSFAAAAGNGSARALEATITTPGANAYDVQAIGSSWTATVGTQYRVSVDIKASVAGGKVRLVNQDAQYQQYDITPTTSWATYTWTLNAVEASPKLRLNFPAAGIYTIDNIKINEITAGGPLPIEQAAVNIDTAMSRFIRASMTRYAGKIAAWDVVNEPMSDGTGALRSNSGTTTGDAFYWSQYLGRDYALKAFNYAKAADPSALLFINDYNLESDSRKLDSLIAYVNELKGKGAKIDGIGTQMHMSTATSKASIDNMFIKMAATGLKVRVSELDIRMNPNNQAGFTPSAQNLSDQADMYKYVAQSFIKNVPAAQRYDITVWGVADNDSWIVTVLHREDFPLLFDANYKKKPAYAGLLLGLKQ
ncbi:MAG: endo-1,4-beta-xylanase [Flavisolibacter sp.]